MSEPRRPEDERPASSSPADPEPGPEREPFAQAPDDEDATGTGELRRVPPFDPRRLQRELRVDALMRGLIVIAVLAVLLAAMALLAADQAAASAVVGLVVVIGGWLALNSGSAGASRELPEIAAMVEADPARAEDRIAQHLARRPLLRWVRLMLYHRLATLRHRQQRFGESAAIGQAVLAYPLGPAGGARAHLLLLLAEAALETRNLPLAWNALTQLYHTRLTLVEALQRLGLQTRYEVMCGYDALALSRLGQKVELAELMPAAQCGAVHAILATAADRTRQRHLADWLHRRAELLCTPDQLRELRGSTATPTPATASPTTQPTMT